MLSDSGLSLIRWFAVALFLALWAVIGWSDFTHQKIKHNLILYGAGGALLGYAALLLVTLLGLAGVLGHFLFFGYYGVVASHLALCAFAAVLLWWLGIWPAGDAKLFILLGALYPLMNVTVALPYERLFLVALINTFLPAALVLFFRAVHYIYDTRLRHNLKFLKQLGWKREISFFSQQSLEIMRAALRELPAKLKGFCAWAASDPKAILGAVATWLVSMAAMSLFSYYLKGFFASPLRLTLLWTGLFMLWRRAIELFGPLARYFAGAAVIALLILRPPSDWRDFAVIFQNITVFSFFMFLGMNWAIKIITGGGGLPFVLPFLLPFLGMLVGYVWSYAVNAVRAVLAALGRLGTGHPGLQALGFWKAWPLASRLGSGAHGLATTVNDLVGGLNSPMARTIFILASMGLFFGLSLVLVRLWDQEVRPIRTPRTLTAYLLLAPAFIDRIRQDGEFFEAHFQKLYPDGLTRDQAEALKGWCVRESIETIPLAPTMSFAAWIFLGYFLSHLLGGAHVLEVVL